jgi:hypothetical protein
MSYINEINIQKFVRIKEQLRIINDNNGPALIINQTGTENILDIQQNSNTVFYIENEGNVGIGTNNPSTKLDVNGIIKGDGSQITNLNYNNITNQPALDNVSDSNFDNKFSYKSTNDLIEGINLYYTEERVNQNILSKNLISLNEENLNSNQLVYYDGESWYNLKIDPRSLEITTDRVLRVIGGTSSGNLNQVVYENETTTTVTSNILPPSLVETVSSGLVAHYKFDDNTNIGLDSSVGGIGDATPSDNSLTATNSQKIIGVSGAVIAQERLDLPNITFGTSNTISFWIKLDMTPVSDDTWNKIFDFSNSTGHRILLERDGNAPKEDWFFYFISSAGSFNQHTISNVLENNVWYHIVISWNSTNVNMYFNNVLKVNNQSSSHFRNSSAYTSNTIGKTTSDQINGYLDDFRIYDRALSAAEVEKLYLEGSDRGLIAHYKFDGDLTDETDITGQLTEPNGNITYNTITQSAIFTSTVSTNYTLTPDINKNVPLSFSFWFRTLTSTDQTMMAYGDYDSKSPSIQFDVNGSRLKIHTALDVPWTISPESSVSINTWYHCVYTLDNSNSVNTKLYLNGVLKQSSTGTASKTLGTYKNLVIGESGDAGRGFNGNIDDLRIYDRALSAAEVEKLYLEGSDRGLVAYYKFDGDLTDETTDNADLSVVNSLNGYSFVDDYINVTGDTRLQIPKTILTEGQTELTISFWCAKISGTTINGNHIIRYKPTNLMIRYNYQSNGEINLLMEGKDAYYTIDLTQDTFTHLLFTVNGETYKIFVNGEEVNWTSISGDSTMDSNGFTHGTSSDKFEFFNNPGASTDFRGKIKNFRIYDRALSVAEVENLYNAQYIQTGSISNSTDEYIAFKYNSAAAVSGQTEYTINFPQATDCEILLLDDTNYKHLETPLESLNGTYTVKVGVSESSISKSGYTKTTATGGTAISSGYATDITGASETYSSKEVIIRYKTTKESTVTTTGASNPILSSLSSLTPETNSLLYFNTSNTVNYLDVDTNSLQITGDYKLKVVDNKYLEITDGINSLSENELELSKHLIPESNAIYDIGSIEKKIRHMFISDNSLWVGDDNKLSLKDGKMRIKKRKKTVIPSRLKQLDPTINETKILSSLNKENLKDLNLKDWNTYLRNNHQEENLIATDLFENDDDYELDAATDAWLASTSNNIIIDDSYSNIGIGKLYPTKKLDVNGDINMSGSIYLNDELISTTNINEGINKYYSEERVDSNIASKKLISFNSTATDKDILYYRNGNWNGLKLDPTTLEITTDNKLKVIGGTSSGGGGGTQVFIQNESDTITSNLEKPIIDSSNLVTDGLIAHYKFDGNYNDSVGTNHLVIDTGTPTYDTNNEYIIANNDISFTISNPSNIITSGQTAMTISFWVNNWTSLGYIMRYRPSNIVIWYNGSSQLEFSAEGQTSQYNSFSVVTSWTLLTMVYDGDNYNLYVNETKKHTVSGSGNFDTGFTHDTSDNIWGIFENPTGSPSFAGHLKDLRFYNRALSVAEVEKLYYVQYISKSLITDSTDEVVSFKYNPNNDNGSGQTEYTINFPEETECDILVVAGGGAGGIDAGGGGGGGGVAYTSSVIKMNGEYTIKVGNGGIFMNNETYFAEDGITDGNNSLITNGTNTIETIGGGSGGYKTSSDKGNNGGSSGGGIYLNNEPPGTVISAIKTGIFVNINTAGGQGNIGGSDYAGGGGGAGGAISSSTANGNDGIQINIDGNNYYWAGGGGGGFGGSNYTSALGGRGGGGGGGNYGNSASNPNSMKGGGGGINQGEDGEYGSSADACKGGDGGKHTGSGGGGGANTTGGNGGSGIVIIRYKTQIVTTVTRSDPKLSSLSSLTPELNSLLYFNTSNSINYLELDPTTLEITTDNKLKVIGGGGGGTQVLIQNESDTITSNLEKPIIDNSNLVTDGLIAHYKFDDSTNVGLDSSGNGYDLTARDGTVSLSSTYAVFNSSSYYTSDSLKTTDFTFHNKAFSVSVWAYFTNTGHIITQHNNTNTNQSLAIRAEAGSNGTLTYRMAFYGNAIIASNYNDTNKWIHLVFQTYSNGNREIYRNGVRIANDTNTSLLNLSGTYDVIVGAYDITNDYYDGYLDDLRIYDRALSAAEVEKLYNVQYIQKSLITGSTDEVVSFKYNDNLYPDIVYDFGLQSISSIATFASYANTIPGISGVSSFDNWNSSGVGGVGAYPNTGHPPGKIQIQLPSTHNMIKVEYQNVYSSGIINMYVDTKTNLDNGTSTPTDSISGNGSSSFETHYNTNDYLQIEDPVSSEGILGRDLKITLSNTQTEYTINFPEETECEILLLDDTNYKHLETPLESLNGTYTIKVGTIESSISNSTYTKTTSGEVMTPQLLSISGYASWDNHKSHAETNSGRLPYRDELIEFLDPDRTEPENYTYSQYLNNTSTASSEPYDVWVPVNDYVGAFVEIGKHPSHKYYTLKTPSGTETYLTKDLETDTPFYTTTAGTSTSSSSIWGNNSSWVPNINIFYVPYYSTDITGTTQTYSSKEVIIRYKTQTVTTVTRVEPKLSSLSSLTPEVNSLLYFNTSNSINYLELDPTTLEITTDNKLKVIGGGGGTQVLIQNESDTITSNLEKPIIDSNSNLVTNEYIQKGSISGSTDEYIAFKYNPATAVSGQTEYNINFPEETKCDILIIGGGGSGGNRDGGGGGAGGVIYATGVDIPAGTYTIKVGNGGDEVTTDWTAGNNGYASEFLGAIALGGGGGGTGDYSNDVNGKDGGSGGGGGYDDPLRDNRGLSIQEKTQANFSSTYGNLYEYLNATGTFNVYGNHGGHGNEDTGVNANDAMGGGGGGAGGAGIDGYNATNPGQGGPGIQISITGTNVWYAGGGGGAGDAEWRYGGSGIGGQGGGDRYNPFIMPGDGAPHTGSGGGGVAYSAIQEPYDYTGKGGSGIVIIRYKTQTVTTVTRSDPKLSSLSSLTPEVNSLLYFNTSNTVNYLELDPTTLEITTDNKLKVIDNLLNKIENLESNLSILQNRIDVLEST